MTLELTEVEAAALTELLNWEVGGGEPMYLRENSPQYDALWRIYEKLVLQGRGEVVPPHRWCAPL